MLVHSVTNIKLVGPRVPLIKTVSPNLPMCFHSRRTISHGRVNIHTDIQLLKANNGYSWDLKTYMRCHYLKEVLVKDLLRTLDTKIHCH